MAKLKLLCVHDVPDHKRDTFFVQPQPSIPTFSLIYHGLTGGDVMSKQKDAIRLLTDDHQKVTKAFEEYKKLGDKAFKTKKKLSTDICTDLEVHTQIEEEILYPEFRKAVKDAKPLADEAKVEHDSAKELIRQIKSMNAEDDLFDAKVTVLSEYIDHHVKEEEDEMFPLLKKAAIDLNELGKRMDSRKQELEQALKRAN